MLRKRFKKRDKIKNYGPSPFNATNNQNLALKRNLFLDGHINQLKLLVVYFFVEKISFKSLRQDGKKDLLQCWLKFCGWLVKSRRWLRGQTHFRVKKLFFFLKTRASLSQDQTFEPNINMIINMKNFEMMDYNKMEPKMKFLPTLLEVCNKGKAYKQFQMKYFFVFLFTTAHFI